jgi:hypothetical protein
MSCRAGGWLVRLWLAAALLVLLLAGRLPEFLAVAAPATMLALAVGVEVRRQLAPPWRRPPAPPANPAWRLADDPTVPLCEVVRVAELAAQAEAGWPEPTVPIGGGRG